MTKIDVMKQASEYAKKHPEYKYQGFRTALTELDNAYKTAYKAYLERLEQLNKDYKGNPPTSLIDENLKACRDSIILISDTFTRALDTEYNRLYSECEKKWNVTNIDISVNNVSEFSKIVSLATDKELANLIRTSENLEPYKIRVLEREIEDRKNPNLRTEIMPLTARKYQELDDISRHYQAYQTISGVKRISEISDTNYRYITALHEQANKLGM